MSVLAPPPLLSTGGVGGGLHQPPSPAGATAAHLRQQAYTGAFSFHSPTITTRPLGHHSAEVTDTSAASTPTHAPHGTTLATPFIPFAMSLPPSNGNGLGHPPDLELSDVSPSHAAAAGSSASAGAASAGGVAPYAPPPRRQKDKLKHSESENRRRMRLRAKFSALKEASHCSKKDRFNILQGAVNKLQEYEARITGLELEKNNLANQLTLIASRDPTAVSAAAAAAVPPAPTAAPSLSTPLNQYQMLANVACCYISLDGRILDANQAFVDLFHFTQQGGNGNGGPPTGPPPPAQRSTAAPADPSARPDDLYSSSIFALTHHGELIHTLSILRNLLCGVMESYECHKRCIDMRGRVLDASMTIVSVTNQGKIVMFLVVFVPKPMRSGGTPQTPNAGASPAPLPGMAVNSSAQGTGVDANGGNGAAGIGSMPAPSSQGMLLASPSFMQNVPPQHPHSTPSHSRTLSGNGFGYIMRSSALQGQLPQQVSHMPAPQYQSSLSALSQLAGTATNVPPMPSPPNTSPLGGTVFGNAMRQEHNQQSTSGRGAFLRFDLQSLGSTNMKNDPTGSSGSSGSDPPDFARPVSRDADTDHDAVVGVGEQRGASPPSNGEHVGTGEKKPGLERIDSLPGPPRPTSPSVLNPDSTSAMNQ